MDESRRDAGWVVLVSIVSFLFAVVAGMARELEPWAFLLTFAGAQLFFAFTQVIMRRPRRARMAAVVALVIVVLIAVNLRIG